MNQDRRTPLPGYGPLSPTSGDHGQSEDLFNKWLSPHLLSFG